MKPLRPIVDRNVLEFVQAHTFSPADFTIRSDGVCRLNPEMARRIPEICVGKSLTFKRLAMPANGKGKSMG